MAQPKPYPGDDYIKSLITASLQGIIKPDANGNYVLGKNASLDGKSVDNIIVAPGVQVFQSHENKIFARNAKVIGTSGATINGADHIIGRFDIQGNPIRDESNYCDISGDAHTVCAYGSSTKGVGNKNFCYAGVVEGMNCVLGDANFPNKYSRSSAKGSNISVIGNDSHGEGANFKIVGDNITVIGIGIGQTITEPGVHILNQK